MLQFFNRDKSWYETLESHGFESFRYGDANEVQIEGDPERYLGKICYIYDRQKLIGSGIVENYSHQKNENTSTLTLMPLIQDLRQEFVKTYSYLITQDGSRLALNGGRLWVNENGLLNITYDADISDIIEDIILQYQSITDYPLLYIDSKELMGIHIKHEFQDVSLLEAINTIINEFIGSSGSIIINPDGGVSIRNSSTTHELTYGNDILRIEYEKNTDEIENSILFDNGKTGVDQITGTYEDSASILKYGKRVKYIKDERFIYQSSVDEYMAAYLQKKAYPIIKVQSIRTRRTDIQLYDRVSISNWEKNIDDGLYVNSITYLKDGFLELDIGTKQLRKELLLT